MDEFTNVHQIALWGFLIAAVFGFVSNKTHFCAMGAISDALHMGSMGRMGAWFLAIGIATLGTQGLALAGLVDLGSAIYLTPNFGWLGYLVGGLTFGVGMTLAAGCGQRNLVRLGGGNLKALVVLLIMGIAAYTTMRGLLGLVRINAIEVTNVDLSAMGVDSQGIPALLGAWAGVENLAALRAGVALLAGAGFIGFALRQRAFRESTDNILAGVVIGLTIISAWFVTGYLGRDDFDPVPVESMSFIAASGNTVNYLMTFTGSTINFGIALVLGMIVGAFAYAVGSGNFRVETFSNRTEMVSHLVGGLLMGFGGVLSLGCTVGQGMTGMSTLAAGSVIALLSIMAGSAVTMKVEYYMLDELGFFKALGNALADLVIPGRQEVA